MSMSANLHAITSIRVYDLYPERPGGTVNFEISDKEGNNVTAFLNDETLRKLTVAIQAYAATREAPRPSYSEALFAEAPKAAADDIAF